MIYQMRQVSQLLTERRHAAIGLMEKHRKALAEEWLWILLT